MNKKLLPLSLVLTGLASTAYSAGYAIKEQSAVSQGNSYAGVSARADNISTIFFNPAGMAKLSGHQAQVNGNYIAPTAEPKDGGTVLVGGALPPAGTTDGDVAENAFTAAMYAMYDYNDKINFGIGITAPFGLTTEYERSSIYRYDALESAVKTININPVMSYKINEKLALGLGLQVQYIDATLSNAIACLAPNVTGAADCVGKSTGDDLSTGVTLGLLYSPNENINVGVGYRSGIDHTLDGITKFELPSPALAGFFPNTATKVEVTTPETVNIGLSWDINDTFKLLAEADWTRWSRFKDLTLQFSDPVAGSLTSVTDENWDDSWFYAIGFDAKIDDKLTLRTGAAFDQTPIEDEFRTPRIPGADRTWFSIGADYHICDNMTVTGAYSYIDVDDGDIDLTAGGNVRNTVKATVENEINIVSIGLNYKF